MQGRDTLTYIAKRNRVGQLQIFKCCTCWRVAESCYQKECLIFILERKFKKTRLPVRLWHFACLSTNTPQPSFSTSRAPNAILHRKELLESCLALFQSCSLLSLSHLAWEFCASERKNCLERCCLAQMAGWEGRALYFAPAVTQVMQCCSGHFSGFLPASIISSSLNCQRTGAGLSTSGLEVIWCTTWSCQRTKPRDRIVK